MPRLTLRAPALVLSCLAVGPVTAAAQVASARYAGLQDQLNEWYRRASRSAPGEWGVAVADEHGQLVWSVNATSPLIPASAVKVFTTGFARATLGPEARQVTRVVGTGYADAGGMWVGTWALELNGDPTLERPSRAGPMLRDLASQLAAQGIRWLNGPLTVRSANGDPSVGYPSVWPARHRGRTFAPLIGAVTLNEGLINFTIVPGERVGNPPVVATSTPEGLQHIVDIQAKTVAGSRDRLRILAGPGGTYVVNGTMGVNARRRYFAGTARDPQAVLSAAWRSALAANGIGWMETDALAAGTSIGQLTLAEIISPPLDTIVAEVNARSLNVGAEALLRWAGGTEEAAAQRLTQHVLEVTGETDGIRLVDGSGLSGDDRATPYSFVKYLANFPTTEAGRNFPLLLPPNGSGTLRRLGTSRLGPGVVRAKTGTLGNVSSLVGYLGHRDGMLLVSVLYNGGSVYRAKQQQWRLFQILGAQGTPVFGGDPAAESALGGTPGN